MCQEDAVVDDVAQVAMHMDQAINDYSGIDDGLVSQHKSLHIPRRMLLFLGFKGSYLNMETHSVRLKAGNEGSNCLNCDMSVKGHSKLMRHACCLVDAGFLCCSVAGVVR